jgi:hypothetical protein
MECYYFRLYSIGVALFLQISLFSQVDPCGTKFSKDDLSWLRSYQQNPSKFYSEGRESIKYAPIKVHIVGDDVGGGYYSLEYLLESICTLNDDFSDMNISFFLWGDLHYINNSDFYEHDQISSIAMFSQNNVSNMLNVYFVNDPNGACGYYSPFWDAIAIKKSCQTSNDHTLSHEVGHYFSLPHTFLGWEGGTTPSSNQQEKVNGSNCQTAADGFCDTPPDYLSYIWGFSNCNSPTLTDPNGVNFQVDGSFIMSYATDVCQSKFSNEQQNAILANLTSQRPYLLNNYTDPTDTTTPANVTIVAPLDQATGVPYNWVALQWDAVSGASAYHVMATKFPTFANSQIDAIVTTNYFIGELEEDETYRWKVKALFDGNTCSSYNCQVFDCPQFTVGSYSNIEELADDKIIYNPLSRRLSIKGTSSIENVKCYDLIGRLILENNINAISLIIPEDVKGNLFFVISSNDKLITKRLFLY